MADGSNLEKQKLNSKWKIGLIVLVVLTVALIGGISVYNSPQNRIERQLLLGNRYLEEQRYEEAVMEFAKAIEIEDRCLEAYVGSIKAYLQTDQTNEMQKFYEKTLDMIAQLDEPFLQENRESIIDIYMYSQEVFKEPEKVVEILEDGLNKTNQSEDIISLIVDEYLEIIEKNPANYEKQLAVYDRLLEITENDIEIIAKLEMCLNKYINILMMEKNYGKIRELASKYKDTVKNINFQQMLDEITELERIEEENKNFMLQIYQAMEAEDYSTMMQLSESAQMDEIVQNLQNNKFIYMSEEMGEGIGVGIHIDKDEIRNIYYGEYKEGKRVGKGTVFYYLGSGIYCISNMEWNNDAPNGQGGYQLISPRRTRTVKGNFSNGLEHGTMDVTESFDGFNFNVTYTSQEGIPIENKTEEYLSLSEYGRIPDNSYVYAYDTETREYEVPYTYFMPYYHNKSDGRKGLQGFADLY